MIEIRVVENGLGTRPDIEYRYHRLQYDWYEGKVNPPFRGEDWSQWQTAEWVKAEDAGNDIPEKPKTLGEIQQEFEEHMDAQVKRFKMCSKWSREQAEERHDRRFDRIIQNFEYAKEHGKFMPKVAIGTLSGSYLVSNDENGLGVFANRGSQASFVIRQGENNPGYYTMGNRRFFKYYMPYKPNAVVRFFMRTCLGLFWMDEE